MILESTAVQALIQVYGTHDLPISLLTMKLAVHAYRFCRQTRILWLAMQVCLFVSLFVGFELLRPSDNFKCFLI